MTEPDEAELDAARTRITVNAAAAKLQRAKAQLKRLEIERAEPTEAYPCSGVAVAPFSGWSRCKERLDAWIVEQRPIPTGSKAVEELLEKALERWREEQRRDRRP